MFLGRCPSKPICLIHFDTHEICVLKCIGPDAQYTRVRETAPGANSSSLDVLVWRDGAGLQAPSIVVPKKAFVQEHICTERRREVPLTKGAIFR